MHDSSWFFLGFTGIVESSEHEKKKSTHWSHDLHNHLVQFLTDDFPCGQFITATDQSEKIKIGEKMCVKRKLKEEILSQGNVRKINPESL